MPRFEITRTTFRIGNRETNRVAFTPGNRRIRYSQWLLLLPPLSMHHLQKPQLWRPLHVDPADIFLNKKAIESSWLQDPRFIEAFITPSSSPNSILIPVYRLFRTEFLRIPAYVRSTDFCFFSKINSKASLTVAAKSFDAFTSFSWIRPLVSIGKLRSKVPFRPIEL